MTQLLSNMDMNVLTFPEFLFSPIFQIYNFFL